MDINTDNSMTAGMFALNQAQNVKNQEVLGALGMTPETQKAEEVIEKSMKEGVAQATGQGINIDFKA